MWNNKVMLGIFLALGVLLTIAIVVVLSLIPLYIGMKDVTVHQGGSGMYEFYCF
jgi:hypothetical protein